MAKLKRKMIQCATAVKKESVRREVIDGAEHIIVSSVTLPDNIVMNGGLYPSEEIEKSFASLERTLAPIEHPSDKHGNFISASDPIAIHNFHAGAFNMNVRRDGGRVWIDKHINVAEAMKTDRGKRLLDRINELETSESPRAMHTSVGVYLTVEQTKGPQVNAAGDEYTWVARDMVFDHDAILLDSIAAATPDKGVGIAVNSNGDEIEVDRIILTNAEAVEALKTELPKSKTFGAMVFSVFRKTAEAMKLIDAANSSDQDRLDAIIGEFSGLAKTNAEGLSQNDLREQLQKSIEGTVGAEWLWVVDVFENSVVFETNGGFFEVPYRVDNGIAITTGIPLRVDRVVQYVPKTNSNSKGDAMKEMILNALKSAGVVTDGLSDDQLFEAYNSLRANHSNQGTGDGGEGQANAEAIAAAVTNALKPLTDKVEGLEAKLAANATKETETMAELVGNSDKYPGIDKEIAMSLPTETLKKMAANCGSAYAIPLHINSGGSSEDRFSAPSDMPE